LLGIVRAHRHLTTHAHSLQHARMRSWPGQMLFKPCFWPPARHAGGRTRPPSWILHSGGYRKSSCDKWRWPSLITAALVEGVRRYHFFTARARDVHLSQMH
jgi:hypothetical protein